MSKVGIMYICTGRYSVFWKDFYAFCEKYFLPVSEKHYYIWTDDENIINTQSDRMHVYRQEVEPWPFPTLKRFSYFLQAKSDICKMDYLIFMNGNLIVTQIINEEEIFPEGEEKLFVTLHPGYFDKTPDKFAYDRNEACRAYIKKGCGDYYFAGGFNGGRTPDFILLMEELDKRIADDYAKGIIAVWHDESQLNKYMYEYKDSYRILSPAYLYPEGWNIPFETKILILDKNKKGGHDFLRGNINADINRGENE